MLLLKKGDNENKVYLNDICAKDQFCKVPPKPWDVFADADVNSAYGCETPVYDAFMRFPGEACELDIQCMKFKDDITGKCVGGKCMGYNVTQDCTEHGQCWVGLYCGRIHPDDPIGKCSEQKKVNDPCGTSYECPNDYLCLAGVCSTKPYSLPVGARVDADGAFLAEVYCQYGHAYKGICSSINQTDSTSKDMDYLRQCNHGEVCHYTHNGLDSFTKPCECGYNDSGFGYCPRGHDTKSDIWSSFYSKKAAAFSNKCHTLSRDACYLSDAKYYKGLAGDENKSAKSHLFYKAVPCADKILSGSFLQYSSLVILTILTLLY